MVSGFVTSPYDQLRICSGVAMLIRIALKSFTSNNVPSRGVAPHELPAGRLYVRAARTSLRTTNSVALFESRNVHVETWDLVETGFVREVDLFLILVQNLYRQRQALQLLDQNLE